MTRSRQSKDSKLSANHVASRRLALRLSQEELSRRAGVSRTLLSSVETGRATPSVKAALAISAALGTTVESLFQETPDDPPAARWAWPPPTYPCRYWEVREPGCTMRYPATLSSTPSVPHDGIAEGGRDTPRYATPPETLVMASCDPAASLLAGEYSRATGYRLLLFPSNSQASLELLAQGKVHLGAIHCASSEGANQNLERVRATLGSGWVLLRAAQWESGLALAPGFPPRSSEKWATRRWAMREPGAIARETMERLLESATVQGRVVHGHWEVANAVSTGWAEVGICVRLCAEEKRLRFLPQQIETLDLVFAAHRLEDRRFRRLIELVQTRSYHETVADLPGYTTRETGALLYS